MACSPLGLVLAASFLPLALAADGVDEFGYYWPRARGHVGAYSFTNHTAPLDLGKHLAWSWHHQDGRYNAIIVGGPVIDDRKNLYITTLRGVYKFSVSGEELWYWRPQVGQLTTSPSIAAGLLHGNVDSGHVFALDMETGKLRWMHRHAPDCGGDTAYVEAYKGIVVTAMEGPPAKSGGNVLLLGLNASTGEKLWEAREEKPVWNFMAMFVGDDTFVYMDINGGIYRRNFRSGARLWSRPPPDPADLWSFTDGFVQLGPGDGLAYTCSDRHQGQADTPGLLRAWTIEDGRLLWEQVLAQPCTTWAVSDGKTVYVGAAPLPGMPGITKAAAWVPKVLLSPLNRFSQWLGPWQRFLWGNAPLKSELYAFDARTGALRWRYSGVPAWEFAACRGDEEGFEARVALGGNRPVCATAGWGSHTLSADGRLYTPHMDGHIHVLGDLNGDGVVAGDDEVSSFETGSASLHMGTAWGPGIMAQATCDGLFVFTF